MPHLCRILLFLCLVVFHIGHLDAAPYGRDGKSITWTQPNGEEISLRVFGNEFYARTETENGYTVVLDLNSRAYHYATISQNQQQLLPNGPLVTRGNQAPDGTPQHLDLPAGSRKTIAQSRKQLLVPSADTEWANRLAAARQREQLKVKANNPRQNGNAKEPDVQRAEGAIDLQSGTSSASGSDVFLAPVNGNLVGLCILTQFPDDPQTPAIDAINFPADSVKMDRYCNELGYNTDGNSGSVRDYYRDQSLNQLDYTHLVTAVITLPNPRNYYDYTDYPANTTLRSTSSVGRLLVSQATNVLINQGFNFSSLSTDGSNNIISISLFFAGNSTSWAAGLWPHRSSLSGSKINVGTVVSPRYVNSYQITDAPSSAIRIGTYIHETAHLILAYPDLYDYGGESNGVGNHCLMAGGTNNNGGRTPAPINGYLKSVSGWSNVVDITATASLYAKLNSTGNGAYRIRKPGSMTEYFFVENRGNGDLWATYVPDKGIAIWHIDELVNGNNNEQMTSSQHYEVSLEQADGAFQMENGINSGDSLDLYDAATRYFNNSSIPGSKWWNGTSSGFEIEVVSTAGPSMNLWLGPVKISVITPNGGETFEKTSNAPITWVSAIAGGDVKIELLKGGILNTTITNSTPNDGFYNWFIPNGLTNSSDYTLRITHLSNPAQTDSSNQSFSIIESASPPTITAAEIAQDITADAVKQGSLVTFTFTFSKDIDDTTVTIGDFSNAGTSIIDFGALTEVSPGVFTLEVFPTSKGSLQIRLNAGAVITDINGNPLDTTSAIIDDATTLVTPVIVYEPFDYPVGAATGQNGGLGFAGGWVASSGASNAGYIYDQTANVTFDGSTQNWNGVMNNNFPTSPENGVCYLGAEAVSSSNVDVSRALASTAAAMADSNGVLWMSVVYHYVNSSSGAGVNIGFTDGGYMWDRGRKLSNANTDFIGLSCWNGLSSSSARVQPTIIDTSSANNSNTWTSFSQNTSGPSLITSKDQIIIMKFTFGASDKVEAFWFNEDTPLASITEAAFNAGKISTTYVTGINENNLNTICYSQGRFNNAFDEIRISDTFEGVISAVGINNAAPVWSANPITETNATEDVLYSSTLANDVSDLENDSLTFQKVSGPAWLNVASNGKLSGTPINSHAGNNSFVVSVTDGFRPPIQATLNITVISTNVPPLANAGIDQSVPRITSLWTPASISLTAWFDAADTLTIDQASGRVSQWNDKSGNLKHALQVSSIRQPAYQAVDPMVNGLPSIGDLSASGSIGLVTPSLSAKNIYVVAYYKDGVDSSFDGYPTLVSGPGSFGLYRVMGNQLTSNLFNTSLFNNAGTYKNGSTVNSLNAVLPMPISLFKFKSSATRTQTYGLGFNQSLNDRDWQGAYCEWIFTDGTEDALTEQKIEGYMAHKWKLNASLPAGHTYVEVPPLLDVVTATLQGIASDGDNDSLITQWLVISGPGSVNIANPSAANTTAQFNTAGTYVLQFSVNDGAVASVDLITIVVLSRYDSWADPYSTLVDKAPDYDFDNGGLANGLEWVLGGNPTIASDDASLVPVTDTSDSDFVKVNYRRSDAALYDSGTIITLEYGSDLLGWTPAIHNGSSVIIHSIDDGVAPGIDLVEAQISRALAMGGKMFTRIKVAVAP